MPFTLEVGVPAQTEAARNGRIFLRRQQSLDLGSAPYIEFSFVPFGIRIQAGIKAAVGRAHIPKHPISRFCGDAPEECFARGKRRARIFAQQLAVVIQHFLEMRNHPLAVDGITAESSTELIEDTAL